MNLTLTLTRYDVYGFVLKEPPSGDAARQLRTMDRGPEVPEHWSNPHPALCPYKTLTLTLTLTLT